MNKSFHFIAIALFLLTQLGCKRQLIPSNTYSPERRDIFVQLQTQDSLLFEWGFNQCDTAQVGQLISEDLEFYHDQGGITPTKEAFLLSLTRLCKLDYKPTRELDPNSLEVHLLKNNGKLYGAIQSGTHRFFGQKGDQPKYLTSIAKFTHLWILEGDIWKLKRVLSYDHLTPP
jgi:hypothetical protein